MQQDLSNAKIIAWEDENGRAYLWGTHNMSAEGAAEAIETHVIETQVVFDVEMFKSFSEAVAAGEALWAHPACLDIVDGAPWPREFVSKEPRPGWVPFLWGEMS